MPAFMQNVFNIKLVNNIAEVDRDQWNGLRESDYPFLRHEFFAALENSHATCVESGWQVQHCLVFDVSTTEPISSKTLIAAMPLYKKSHSNGEYVFDQNWAQSYQMHGLKYYPKWLTAIPFTPCEGPRILIKQGVDRKQVYQQIIKFLSDRAEAEKISSWHCLFAPKEDIQILANNNLSIREGLQFRWSNKGYTDFDDYLSTFSMKKRKNLRRERRWLRDENIQLKQIPGDEITESQWHAFYPFYQMTYLKRRMLPYFNLDFFLQLAESMPEQLLLILAVKENSYIGAALSLLSSDTLYGRYWGCFEEYKGLHFEACYYQGLEYCIANKLQRFDSGAQGEHKISRGFEPVTSYSAHWLRNEKFAARVDKYVRREAEELAEYKKAATLLLPFKKMA